jgi:hypothetical protein|tara:strand:+ start:877 stop:1029 length:153 start_codon:yes stop_codon:yes gene_type:complete
MSKQFLEQKIKSLVSLKESIIAFDTKQEDRTYSQNQLVDRIELLKLKLNK